MANKVCTICRDEYSTWSTVCPVCGVALVESTTVEDLRQLPADHQVVYELGGWTLDQRAEVAAAIAEAGVNHAWNDDELIVHVDDEAIVDELLEPIEGAGPTADIDPNAQTEYDLGEWSAEERALIAERVTEAGVPHLWEGNLLLVPVADEAVVDDILDDVEEGGGPASLEDDGEETPFEVLEALFLAAKRLEHDEVDGVGVEKLADGIEAADPARPPFGVAIAVWHRALGVADELADALSGQDGVDHATAQAKATELHAILRDYV